MSATYVRRTDVLWRSTSGGPVLLASEWPEPRILQGVAALVWEVLDAPLTVEQVEAELRDLTPDLPQHESVIRDLVELGVVEAAP